MIASPPLSRAGAWWNCERPALLCESRYMQSSSTLADLLVKAYGGIAAEKLNVAGLLSTKWFSKIMSQQRLRSIDLILEYKAASGIQYAGVNPSHTSTDRSQCGHRQKMPLSVRIFRCEQCGLSMCRDINPAINVCARGYSWFRGRVGHDLAFPYAVRFASLCCKTSIGSGRAMLADIAEQHHLDAPTNLGIQALPLV